MEKNIKVTVGRGEGCSIRLSDNPVSHRHCAIYCREILTYAVIAATGCANFLTELTRRLAATFDTTRDTARPAPLQAVILVFLLDVVQGEEGAFNYSARYCLDNLINRLYEEKGN